MMGILPKEGGVYMCGIQLTSHGSVSVAQSFASRVPILPGSSCAGVIYSRHWRRMSRGSRGVRLQYPALGRQGIYAVTCTVFAGLD